MRMRCFYAHVEKSEIYLAISSCICDIYRCTLRAAALWKQTTKQLLSTSRKQLIRWVFEHNSLSVYLQLNNVPKFALSWLWHLHNNGHLKSFTINFSTKRNFKNLFFCFLFKSHKSAITNNFHDFMT